MHKLALAERQGRIDASTTEFNRRMAEEANKGGLLSGILKTLI